MPLAYHVERQLALQAARAAARLCEQVRSQPLHAITKSDSSPVTVADLGAQAVICQMISTRFPTDPIVAEEDATELRKKRSTGDVLEQVTDYVQNNVESLSCCTPAHVADWIDRGNSTGEGCERFWTLDPIDGTKGFLRDKGQYAVALSLIEQGTVKVGVLACPAFVLDEKVGWMFVAVHGQGAFRIALPANEENEDDTLEEIPVKVSNGNSNLRFVESVEAAHGNQERQGKVARAVGITPSNSLRMDSQAKYAAVAVGSAALYLRLPSTKKNYIENIWDHAAGVVIVEEAGGTVTDVHGKKLDFTVGAKLENNQGVVVSNGALHSKVLEALC